jgi:hypothetical protein
MRFEYTLVLEVDNPGSQNFVTVENRVRELSMAGGRELLTMVFRAFEQSWQCSHKNYRHRGREEASFKSSLGEIRFDRLRVTRNDRNLYPLDQ